MKAGTSTTAAKRVDRFMKVFISAGGLTIIAAVVGILFFIGKEAVPLFFSSSSKTLGTAQVPGVEAVWVDESGKAAFVADRATGIRPISLPQGKPLPGATSGPSLPWTQILPPTAKGQMAVVDAQGRLAVAQLVWSKPAGENDPAKWTMDVQWSASFPLPTVPKRLLFVRGLDAGGLGGGQTYRALAETDQGLAWADALEGSQSAWHTLNLPQGAIASAGVLSNDGHQAYVGTTSGMVLQLDLEASGAVLAQEPFGQPITAMGFALGQSSVLVGGQQGQIAAYQVVRQGDAPLFQRFHTFEPLTGAVRGFEHSLRDKRFLVWGDAGVEVLHLTSEQRLMKAPMQGLGAAALSSRGDFLALATEGSLRADELHALHPEVTLATLWNKVHYEGYAKPEYIWQSSGGGDDFEPKFSLRPLVFGTLKGTLYALLFAVPVAVLGALYTSQFASAALRNRIKPTIEIMAALPSVVLGFVAGLVLAPLFERLAVAIALAPLCILFVALLAMPLWGRMPAPWRRIWGEGREALWLIPVLVGGFLLARGLSHGVEQSLLHGNYRGWLNEALGLTFDQRNSLVVGFAMGFAVIPIIFTISEDALSSVPKALTSASLACGASPWQTAWRVVLPTASPGIFSAVMVGLGRAIGETMIVLMATGNTPVMEWNPFNGMRTLSANIAVEIPEAPHHGSLYRVLFLAALLLFALTFLFNTAAEVIRQRLRKKYESY
jgi:phosphate transport system permease protein